MIFPSSTLLREGTITRRIWSSLRDSRNSFTSSVLCSSDSLRRAFRRAQVPQEEGEEEEGEEEEEEEEEEGEEANGAGGLLQASLWALTATFGGHLEERLELRREFEEFGNLAKLGVRGFETEAFCSQKLRAHFAER